MAMTTATITTMAARTAMAIHTSTEPP
jgi:hypothetical protein